ncbi:UNVERIFIED_CONTAM: hypothetical protein GTU68_003480 [Idotea baltica]|nr:hypothetical protein [Idotea baltica]
MKQLEGKNTLVTGATRGIGRGIALEYAQQGANVAFTYVSSPEKAEALAEELRAFGVKASAHQVNAADFDATTELVKQVHGDYGSIDVIVNNAGITVMKVNMYSIFYMTKASLRYLLKQRSGSIINISSIVGVTGNAGQANYAASKAAAIGFTKSIAKEVGSRNIRANVIAPGFIQTEMTQDLPEEEMKAWLSAIPLKRPGTVQDVANLCTFLGSDLSSYISGQVLHVNGGMYM